jgi:hypothetical protein
MRKLAIGIDPGKSTGFAVKDIATGEYLTIETMPIHQAMIKVVEMIEENPAQLYFVVEDARKRTWYNDKSKNAKAARGMAMGGASVKRDCTIWDDFLSDWAFNFVMKAPKDLTTKMDKTAWQRATKWTKRTSEHARDAACFIMPLNPRNLKLFFRELTV